MSKKIAYGLLLAIAASPLFTGRVSAQCNSNDSKAPCFANNTDILNGRNSLLHDDDLTVVGAFGTSGFPVAGAAALTTKSQITSLNPTNLASTVNSGSVPVSVAARLFNEKNAQVISAASNPSGTVFVSPDAVPVPVVPVVQNAQSLYAVSADFLGTGFDQVIMMAHHFNAPLSQIAFQGIAAIDPNSPALGLRLGPPSVPVNNASVIYAIAAGVFTDPVAGKPSTRPEIAVYSSDPAGGKDTAVITFFAVDSHLNVTPTGRAIQVGRAINAGDPVWSLALAAGRFAGSTHDQLAASYAFFNDSESLGFATLDFDLLDNPVLKTNSPVNVGFSFVQGIYFGGSINLQTGHFNWYGATDQAAFAYSPQDFKVAEDGAAYSVQVVSFDEEMNPTFGNPYQNNNGCPMGLAVGRFDQYETNPNPPPAQQPNPNMQIAQFVNEGCGIVYPQQNVIALYDVDPNNNFEITPHPFSPIPATIFSANPLPYSNKNSPFPPPPDPVSVQIVAADLQGRSVPLGPPTKATITGHIQPDTVLGVPPMHVDWITPAGSAFPEVLNVSVFPGTFNTAYSFENAASGTVNRSGETSFTAATKLSANEKISFGIPAVASVSLSATQAASSLQKNTIAAKYNTYSGNTIGFSTNTVFDDVVAATISQMNIYSYRVIGQCVAATDAPALEGCPTGTQPLYIQFSGPDNIVYVQAAEGRNLEWYQPVWEPGNLFSYPANPQQLAADLAGGAAFQPLSPTNDLWDVQTSSKVTENWTQGSGSSVSSGSQSTQSFDASVSASAMVSFDGFGVGGGVSYDYNDSTSASTLNESSTRFADSQGIVLSRGVGITSEVYDYQGQSLIYGQLPPQNTVDPGNAPSTDVKANGYIAVAHLADMVSQGAITSGNFWPQAYAGAPDIALNHPQRWLQKTPAGVNPQQVQFNCPVGYTSALNSPSCSSRSEPPTPANVADAPFYQMKGLFITPGGSTNGPQMENTVKGNTITLRARIYNYSLVNFPAGSYAHVQFYAQRWDPELGEFASVPGNPGQFAPAVFIGETDIAPPPAFCGGLTGGGDPCLDSQVLNWEYAQTSWDTSAANVPSDSTWKFWVLVWVENNGKMVSELPGHGLNSLPTAPYNSIGDAPIEPYSNNLGYYNQVFTVLGKNNLGRFPGNAHLSIGTVTLPAGATLMRDHQATLKTTFKAAAGDVASTMALYYDGDPGHGGQIFDTQSISRIAAGRPFVDRASYTPQTCGVHELFVEAIPQDGSVKPASASLKVEVTIDPVESINEMIQYVQGLPYDKSSAEIGGHLRQALQEFEADDIKAGRESIRCLLDYLAHDLSCDHLPEKARKALSQQSEDLLDCIP